MTILTSLVFSISLSIFIGIQLIVFFNELLVSLPAHFFTSLNYLPEYRSLWHPKWDLYLYICFVALVFVGAWLIYYWFEKKIKEKDALNELRVMWWMEVITTTLILMAAYKQMIYDNSPMIAHWALIILLVYALIQKIFWLEYFWFLKKIYQQLWLISQDRLLCRWIDLAVILLLLALIALKNPQAVVAQMFMGEQVHHFDFFIMTPGWAALHGLRPYQEVMSQYGVGVPVIFPPLIKFLWGSFDYENTLKTFIGLGITYYIGLYFFLQILFQSRLLSLTIVLACFRFQFFHAGVSPLVWTYPSTTPLRFGFDWLFFLILLLYMQQPRQWLLAMAGALVGFQLFYMTSTGVALGIGFGVFVLINGGIQQWRVMLTSLLAVGITYVGLMAMVYHQDIFQVSLWRRLIEYIEFFAHGHAGGVVPFFESLKYRHYGYFIMACLLPLVLMGAILAIGARIWQKKAKPEEAVLLALAIYGLVVYQYFVVRSAITTYCVGIMPLLAVIGFGILVGLKVCTPKRQWQIKLGLLGFVSFILVTNHNYISYPNIFNFSSSPVVDIAVAQRYPDRQGYFNHLVRPIKEADKLPVNSLGETQEDIRHEDQFNNDQELLAYVNQAFDFSQDAQFIAGLTKPQERVALISSFETRILMLANRAPFFYHLPLLTSRPMRMRTYPADCAHSPKFLEETLRQLEEQKPAQVFMEKIFLSQNVPITYDEHNHLVMEIIRYVHAHYVPGAQGHFLVAMQRKD